MSTTDSYNQFVCTNFVNFLREKLFDFFCFFVFFVISYCMVETKERTSLNLYLFFFSYLATMLNGFGLRFPHLMRRLRVLSENIRNHRSDC